MSKVEFYINPIELTGDIVSKEFEEKIFEYCNLLEEIKKDNTVYITRDFYEHEISNGITISEYIFGNIDGISYDVRDYMMNMILEITSYDEDINKIIQQINEKCNCKYKALVGSEENNGLNYPELYIDNFNKILNAVRYYIQQSSTLEEFKDLILDAYPNIFFHERVFSTMCVFRDITSHRCELNRHLSALNDRAKDTYRQCNNNSDEFYKVFGIKNDIILSGRGSNEGLERYKCKFINDSGNTETIRCNPHTKLYKANSNYRIYFNFGRANIKQDRILVAHIGNHWR